MPTSTTTRRARSWATSRATSWATSRATSWAAACSVGVLLLGASACGSDDPDTGTATQPQGDSLQVAPGGDDQQGRFPGADGKVAAVDGNTAQVQSRGSGQVAVSWDATTTFTKQVSASLDDVKAGTCVMVQPADDDGAGSDDSDATKVTAGSVRITEKVDGECAGGMRGGPGFTVQGPGGGAPPDGAPDAPLDGAPDGAPDGARPQVRSLGGAFGEVTAVSATGFTVASTVPRFEEGSQTPSIEEVTVSVTVEQDTTYTTTGKGSAADVKTGACLRAEGTVDDTGAVAARTIAMSPATDGECGGMVFRSGAGPAGSGPVSGSTTSRES